MFKIKNINRHYFVWSLVFVLYLLFIGYCTWLYPPTGDEIIYQHELSFLEHLYNFIFEPYMALRIGCLFTIAFLHTGLMYYKVINPFVQLSLLLSVFYFLYMHFPRFNSFKDLPPFILILVLGTFFIASPSDVLIWVGGATNYSWVFIAFIWFLIYLRKLNEGKTFNGKYFPLLAFLGGLFLGLINENNSPMVLVLMFSFFIYSRFKKIVLKTDFLFMFIGVMIGVYILLALGGNDIRMQIVYFGIPIHRTITEKLFIHLHRMNNLSAANLCLIYLMPLFLFLLALDKRKEIFKDCNFYLSVLCWGVALGLSVVLFEAPVLATRAFYSASWFCIFSLFFMLFSIDKLYKVNTIKYLSFIFLLIFLYILPFFTLNVGEIYDMFNIRQNLINTAKEKGNKEVYVEYLDSESILPENLKVIYWDPLEREKQWSIVENIEIKNILGSNVRHM